MKDEKILKEFIEWLPELTSTEKYYLCLFARNKYCKELTHIKSDKAQLKRFVTDKERMFLKIKQLEVEVGWYKQKEMIVPQEALALYITVNPRCLRKATVNTMVKLAQSIRDENILMNCHQEALSEIQKAKSRTCWVDFDYDTKEDTHRKTRAEYLHEVVKNFCGDEVDYKLLETRGGYHLLVNPESVAMHAKSRWYQGLMKIGNCDQVGDNMIPVPGSFQGGFIPQFVNL